MVRKEVKKESSNFLIFLFSICENKEMIGSHFYNDIVIDIYFILCFFLKNMKVTITNIIENYYYYYFFATSHGSLGS